MFPRRATIVSLISCSLACGGNSTTLPSGDAAGSGGTASAGGSDSAGGSNSGGSGGTTALSREPAEHRAVREVCDDQRSAYNAGESVDASDFDAGLPDWIECQLDSECTEGVRGRCQSFRSNSRCTYDLCQQDSECSLGGPCGCEQSFWSEANSCLAGNCQLDSDCGDNGYCSPTLDDCGDYSRAYSGYYCHTPDDECVDDADCTEENSYGGRGYCRYASEVGHWLCGYGSCVG